MKRNEERKKEEETYKYGRIRAKETWTLWVCVAMASDDAKSKGIRRRRFMSCGSF